MHASDTATPAATTAITTNAASATVLVQLKDLESVKPSQQYHMIKNKKLVTR